MTDPSCLRFAASDWKPLLLLLAAFGALCLWNLDAFEMLIWDEAEYACLARSIATGAGYGISGELNSIRPPLWPASIAAVLLLSGSGAGAGVKVATLLYALLTISIVYWIVRLECGVAPALVAGAALAMSPEFTVGSVMLLSEIPFMALNTAALAAFYLAFRQGGAWFYVGWTCFALALSVRYTALLFGPTLVLLWVYEWGRDGENLRRLARTRAFWLAPLAAVAILAPWYVRQWLVFGDALIGVKYASTQIPDYSDTSLPWHYYLVGVLPAMTPPIALAALASSLHGVLIARRRLAVYAIFGAVVILGWHMTYDYKEFRLVSASLPLLAIALGVATRSWMDWRPQGVSQWAAPLALVCVGLVMSAVVVRGKFRTQAALGEQSFLKAMDFVRTATPPDTVLIAENQAQVHWHGQRKALRVSREEESFHRLSAGADWVVVTSFERGQPEYLLSLAARATPVDVIRGDVKSFRDARFQTMLLSGDWVRARIAGER